MRMLAEACTSTRYLEDYFVYLETQLKSKYQSLYAYAGVKAGTYYFRTARTYV